MKYLQLKGKFAFSLLVLVVLGLGSAGSAKADSVTFTIGNNPQPNEENVLLSNGTTGNPVFGVTNMSGITVRFSSTTDTLTEPSGGQARVEAVDQLLNQVTLSLPGGSFTDVILNPFQGSGTANVLVTFSSGATQSFSYTLGNGQNFLTIFATMGTISSVSITSTGGFSDLRQPRISGAKLNAVPEPATMLLLGTGLTGLAGAIRRRKARRQ